jgi:hypothetical protein
MDKQLGSRDLHAEPVPPGEPLRPVPASEPAGPSRKPGPKTPQGKARVRHKAMRSGIYATDPVIPGERPEDWQAHRAGILASAQCANELETYHAECMASLSWRLKRVTRADQAEFTRANKGRQEFRLPLSNELDKIMKAEAHLSRLFNQHEDRLEVLQKQRRGEATPLARLDVQGVPEP